MLEREFDRIVEFRGFMLCENDLGRLVARTVNRDLNRREHDSQSLIILAGRNPRGGRTDSIEVVSRRFCIFCNLDSESRNRTIIRSSYGCSFSSRKVIGNRNLFVTGPEDRIAVAFFLSEGCTGLRNGCSEADFRGTGRDRSSLLLTGSENKGC